MSKSLEALNKMIEKYDWVGKEYCRLIGKNESLHKVNQEVFEDLANTIKQDLERLVLLEEENETLNKALDFAKTDYTTTRINLDNASARIKDLEKENQELKKALKGIDTKNSLLIKDKYKLKKAIEILKKYLFLADEKSLVWNKGYEHSTEVSDEDFEALKEVLGNE